MSDTTYNDNDGTLSRFKIYCYDKNGQRRYIDDSKLKPAPQQEQSIFWELLNIPTYRKKKLNLKEVYERMVKLCKKLFVLSDDIEYKIYVLWIMSTWKVHQFNSVSFLSFISAHNSGKTKLLEGIVQMGNKGVLATTTPVVITKLSHSMCAIPLIDECHDLNTKPQLFEFCKKSYRRGSKYIKSKEGSDTEFVVLNNFGFKAFAGEEGFENSALADRCISINPSIEGVPEIQKFSYVQDELDEIRDDLLLFAKENGFNPDLGNDYKKLTGRTRELYEPIISVARHIGISYDDIEEHAITDKEEKRESRSTTVEYEVLSYINDTPGRRIYKSEIISYLGWDHSTVDNRRKSGARFGYQFINKCHIKFSGKGYYNQYIDLGDDKTYDKLKNLWISYGIERKYDLRERKKYAGVMELVDDD